MYLKGWYMYMKKLLLLIPLLLVSCAAEPTDPLAYQDGAFRVSAAFLADGGTFRAEIASIPTETGNDLTLTIKDGPLDGVTFGFGENDFIGKDGTKIPMESGLDGAYEIAGMFDIDKESFYSAEETPEGSLCTFTDGGGMVKYEVLIVDSLPKRIRATLDERVIIAEIDEFLPG